MNQILSLGLAIKAIREDKKLSMRQLAEKASVSVSTISLIESGERDPGFSTLMSICEALDIKLIDLLELVSKLNESLLTIEKKHRAMKQKKAEISELTNSLSETIAKLKESQPPPEKIDTFRPSSITEK